MRRLLAGLVLCAACSPAAGQAVNGGGTVSTTPTVSTLTTGTMLEATGTISPDGRNVTMQVNPTVSRAVGFDTFDLAGRKVSGGVEPVPLRPAQVGKVILVDADKKLLATEVPAMTLEKTSLKGAARALAEATKSNVVLGARGLEQAGVDVNTLHTFGIARGTLKEALLGVIKTAAPDTDMVITAEEGVVQVMTQAQADNVVVTRSYYLEDLLANLPRIVPGNTDLDSLKKKGAAKQQAVEAREPVGTLDTAASQPSVAGSAYPTESRVAAMPEKRQSYSTSIAEIISSSVRPEIWKMNGGKIGEIAVVGNLVIIKAPQSVHALLDGPKHFDPNARPKYVGYGTDGGARTLP